MVEALAIMLFALLGHVPSQPVVIQPNPGIELAERVCDHHELGRFWGTVPRQECIDEVYAGLLDQERRTLLAGHYKCYIVDVEWLECILDSSEFDLYPCPGLAKSRSRVCQEVP